MKKLFFASILMLQSIAVFAQGTVKGVVKDGKGEAVPFANVMILSPKDSSIVKLGATEAAGTFEVPGIPAGKYLLAVSMVGYEKYVGQAFEVSDKQTYQAAEVALSETAQSLKEVEVIAQRQLVEVKADMTVLNVSSSPTAIGKDALELLQKAPGVVVDKDDNIILQGRNGTRIYIDGKPSRLSAQDLAVFLKSMQASNIEAIEIITNPSAKYDAEGTAGIINIKLKKNENYGTHGTVSLGLQQAIFTKANGSLTLNNRNKKTNLYANITASEGTSWNRQTFNRHIGEVKYDQNAIQAMQNQGINFKTGADYYLSKKSTLGAAVSGSFFDGKNDNESKTFIDSKSSEIPSSALIAGSDADRGRNNLSTNLNYRYSGGNGRELVLDADYTLYRNRALTDQPNYYKTIDEKTDLFSRIFQFRTDTDIDIYTFKADYEQKLLGGKLGAGGKFALVETDNNFSFFNVIDGKTSVDSLRTNRFLYSENVNAAYVNFSKAGQKWSYQLGLRGEQTNSLGDLVSFTANNDEKVERHYFNLFPSAGFTYKMNKKNALALNYSRRIDRPNYQNLNPFEFRIDELTFMRGNPFLKPQYTNSLALTHTLMSMVNTSLSYSHTTDYFAQIVDSVGAGRAALTQKNLATNQTINLTVSSPFQILKWWTGYANLSAYRSIYQTTAEAGNLNIGANTFSMMQQHTFALPKGFKAELSGFYNSPSIWGGTFRMKKMWGVDVGAQKQVLKGKGTVKVSYTDIFNTMKWRGTSSFAGVNMNANGAWESQMLRFNFTYNFGNNKAKGKMRKTGADDENKRLGGE